MLVSITELLSTLPLDCGKMSGAYTGKENLRRQWNHALHQSRKRNQEDMFALHQSRKRNQDHQREKKGLVRIRRVASRPPCSRPRPWELLFFKIVFDCSQFVCIKHRECHSAQWACNLSNLIILLYQGEFFTKSEWDDVSYERCRSLPIWGPRRIVGRMTFFKS